MLGFQPISDEPISSVANEGGGGGPTAYTLTADAGSFTLSGQDAGFVVGRILTADAGSFALTGQDAALRIGRVITADAGAFVLTGQDATLTVTPAGGTAYTLTAEAGSFALTGQDAQFLVSGGFPFGGTGGGLAQIKPRESEEQKRTRRIAQGIIREAQKPAADVEKLAKKAERVSAQLKADIAYFEALAEQYAREIEQTRLAMQARNDALATRQLEQRMIQAQLLAEAAAQQREELDVVFMAVMLAALE